MKKYFQAPWTTKETLTIFFLSLLIVSAFILFTSYIDIKNIIGASNNKSLILYLIFVVEFILLSLPLFYISKKKGKLTAENLGFKKIGLWKIAGLILWGYLVFVGITIIISMLTLYADIKIPGYQVQDKLLPYFGHDTLSIVLAGLLVIILAPLFEEIFFRGFLLRSLVDKIGVFLGSVTTAFLFALLHMQFSNIIPLFIVGLIINALVIKSRSIWPAIGFHAFNNAIALLVEILLIKEIVTMDHII